MLQDVEQGRAGIAAPLRVRRGFDNVPAFEGGDGHGGGHGQAGGGREFGQRMADVGEGLGRVVHGIQLVHGEDDGRHAQELEQQAVASGLGEQLEGGIAPVELGGVHQHHGGVCTGGGGHHVAGVLLVARRVADDEFAAFGVEVAVGDVDGDALLALGRQAVGQQCQVGFALALHAGEVVLQHGLAVNQQTANQGAFAIVHRTAGDELQGGAGFGGRGGRNGGAHIKLDQRSVKTQGAADLALPVRQRRPLEGVTPKAAQGWA